MRRPLRLLPVLALCLLPATAQAQVQVDVRTSKATYMEGEPIFVAVDVKNVGPFPLGHSDTTGMEHVKLRISGREPRSLGSYDECDGSALVEMATSIVNHPPVFVPGETVSFKYVLAGYKLPQGEYALRVSGHAEVLWFDYATAGVQTLESLQKPRYPPLPARRGDPVPGAEIDREFTFVVTPAIEGELKGVYRQLANRWAFDRAAVEAIVAMAAPAAADVIGELASNDNDRIVGAYDALAEINTPATRARLRSLFDASDSLRRRTRIVAALSRTKATDNAEFFTSLLGGGRTTPSDEAIKSAARRGLACLGGR
jgi:hypothetical protein